MSRFKAYRINYISKDWKYKIYEGDKVILTIGGKTLTCFIVNVGSRYTRVSNGIRSYVKPRTRDGMYQQFINFKEIEISQISNICKYPKTSQVEPIYISNDNWRVSNDSYR